MCRTRRRTTVIPVLVALNSVIAQLFIIIVLLSLPLSSSLDVPQSHVRGGGSITTTTTSGVSDNNNNNNNNGRVLHQDDPISDLRDPMLSIKSRDVVYDNKSKIRDLLHIDSVMSGVSDHHLQRLLFNNEAKAILPVQSDQIIISILLARVFVALLLIIGIATPISLGVLTQILEDCGYLIVAADNGIVDSTMDTGIAESNNVTERPGQIRLAGKRDNNVLGSDQIVISILLDRFLILLLLLLGIGTPITIGVLTQILQDCCDEVVAMDGVVVVEETGTSSVRTRVDNVFDGNVTALVGIIVEGLGSSNTTTTTDSNSTYINRNIDATAISELILDLLRDLVW